MTSSNEWKSIERDGHPKVDGIYFVYGRWGSGKEDEGECEFYVHDGYFRTAWNFTVYKWKEIE